MRCLAIETAGAAVAVAVATESGQVLESTAHAERRHVEALHPAIERLCAEAGVRLADLDGIGVDIGPGLFTGIRVGVAAAKGIAMALGLPVVGVTSLEILAEGASAGSAASAAVGASATVVPVVDLRRGEVAWSGPAGIGWGPLGDLVSVLEEAGLRDASAILAGDGALRYAGVLVGPEHPGWRLAGGECSSPPVASLARLTLDGLAGGRGVDSAHLEPCYLREADARINWTTRHDGPLPGGR
jgi:tRNA threonylcarbamoyladenosine biosynthesis protein TsaB